MSQLDRDGLISQSNFLFPTNTTGEITAADVRQFDLDIIDSFALTGSSVISASYADNALSASHAIISDNAIEIFVSVKNTSGFDIPKGYAVHSTGVTGDKINVITASYDDPNLMPAIGITQEAISNNAVGEVILTGRIIGINTANLIEGGTVYVNGDGSLTATRPTGSALIQNIGTCVKVNATEGEILVLGAGRSNDIPNIQNGYFWVGDGNGVPQAVPTSSISVDTSNLATTGSNTFNGNQIVSGSVTIQDTNAPMSGLVLRNATNSPSSEIQIIPAGDFITTFNNSSLTGINTYGGDKISGSWGTVGFGIGAVGSTSPILYNAYTGSTSQAAIRLQHRTDPNVQGISYNSFASFPPTVSNGGIGTVDIKGTKITLQATTSSLQTSVNVIGDVTASNISTDTLSPKTGGGITVPNGNLEFSGTGQVINNPNGTVEANEVAAPTILTDLVEPNTTTKIKINGDTEVTASATTSRALNVWDKGYTDGGQPFPIFSVYSSQERTVGGVAAEVAGGAFFAPSLQSEPIDSSTTPLLVTDGTEPRITVNSQDDATSSGNNVVINGNTYIGGAGKDVTISAGTQASNGNLILSGSSVSLTSGTPMNFNSAVTFNGATAINAGIYQNKRNVVFTGASGSITNETDNWIIETNNNVDVNVDSLIGGSSRRVRLLCYQGGLNTGSITLSQTTGTPYTIVGPSGTFTGGTLTTTQATAAIDYIELTNMDNALHITTHLLNLSDSTF